MNGVLFVTFVKRLCMLFDESSSFWDGIDSLWIRVLADNPDASDEFFERNYQNANPQKIIALRSILRYALSDAPLPRIAIGDVVYLRPFYIRVGRVISISSLRRARVRWLGGEITTERVDSLSKLANLITEAEEKL